MLLAIIGTVGMLSFSIVVLIVGVVMLAGFLEGCTFSFSLEHKPRQAETPLALPDYSRAAWYPVALESPYKTVITIPLPYCFSCGHPYEEDATYFCGYCGTASSSLQ